MASSGAIVPVRRNRRINFTTQLTLTAMGGARPRFALFLSQDDHALKLSKSIGGAVTRLGDVDPDQGSYRSDFQREGILAFDLTGLRGGAHSRAFKKVTSDIRQTILNREALLRAHLRSGDHNPDADY